MRDGMILVKNGDIYAPEHLGIHDILISGDKIVWMGDSSEANVEEIATTVIDCRGKLIFPGLIDQHVHIIGGGGEMGFGSRTNEISLQNLVESGITTVVGLLGTDGITRALDALYGKAMALTDQGITAYLLTGSYEYPSVTLTGTVKSDIVYVSGILGAKIAIGDHRSSYITFEEFTRLATQVRNGGLLSGKQGVLVIHTGTETVTFDYLDRVRRETKIPVAHFKPTHVNRCRTIFEKSVAFAKIGGHMDISTFPPGEDGLFPEVGVLEALRAGVPLENITISSDGNGSLPIFDEHGAIKGFGVSSVETLYKTIVLLIKKHQMEISDALKLVTSNVANSLGIQNCKGVLQVGMDGDMLVVEPETLEIVNVLAKGVRMI